MKTMRVRKRVTVRIRARIMVRMRVRIGVRISMRVRMMIEVTVRVRMMVTVRMKIRVMIGGKGGDLGFGPGLGRGSWCVSDMSLYFLLEITRVATISLPKQHSAKVFMTC